VDVDAVLFWVAWDSQKAGLKVQDCRAAIGWVAQAALRDTPAPRLPRLTVQFGAAFGCLAVNGSSQRPAAA